MRRRVATGDRLLLYTHRDITRVNIGNKINKNNNNETKLKMMKIPRINACNKALNSLEQFTNYTVNIVKAR